MSGTGRLVRTYLERAIIEAGAGSTLRERDVRAELAELEASLDRQDETLAEAIGIARRMDERITTIMKRLELMDATIGRIFRDR